MRHRNKGDKAIVISHTLTRFTFAAGVLVLGVLLTLVPVAGQSGRTQDPTRKKVKPVPPDPLPRPRTIDPPRNEDGTIRINSDLVTVITTVTRSDGGIVGNLEATDFEVLEDGVIQEISNFARVSDVPPPP